MLEFQVRRKREKEEEWERKEREMYDKQRQYGEREQKVTIDVSAVKL